MRRLLLVLFALTLLPASSASATGHHGTGGTAAPSYAGGMTYGQPVQKVRPSSRRSSRPVASEFSVAPSSLAAGAPATFTFRVDASTPKVRVRIVLARSGVAPVRLRLGYRPTGLRQTYVWTPAAGALPAGDYKVKLQAFDDGGRALRRTAQATGRGHLAVQVAPPPTAAGPGRFPIAGPYTFGGPEGSFGAARDGHVHEGQDISAAAGTPLISPVATTVYWIRFQRDGAGHYVVLRGVDGTDYVFMHLLAGSITTTEGASLAAGQPFAAVGSTGASSGPHLHFEIWPDGWYSSAASHPIDPLSQLMAWGGAR